MRQAKRCDCSFQQSGNAVAGERIRVNAASSCGRTSYTCQNRCEPKPCAPRSCERVCRPNPCTSQRNSMRWNGCQNGFESSYRRAMDNSCRCNRKAYDPCDDDDCWCDDYNGDWYFNNGCDWDCGCQNRRRRHHECDHGCDQHECESKCEADYR